MSLRIRERAARIRKLSMSLTDLRHISKTLTMAKRPYVILSTLRRSRKTLRLKLHFSLLMSLRKIFLASVITYIPRRVERILQVLRRSLQ